MSGLLGNGGSRRPLLRVLVNGVPVTGALRASIESNNHYAADRFEVSLALGADPVANAAFWSTTGFVMLDASVGFVPFYAPAGMSPAWTNLISGAVDTVAIDAVSQIVRLSGRDLTAAFVEARTQETFANQTASEIATTLAGRHNIAAVVTPTTTPVGRYYQLEHDRITLDQFSRATTEWNLLVWLAEREGFDVFVQGATLYFQPPAPLAPPALVLSAAASEFGAANVTDLRMERSLTLAGDIAVTVKSWNSRLQSAFNQTVTSTGVSSLGSQGATPQTYVFVRPNLTPDEALKFAEAKLAELTLHEKVIIARMPGELTLTARSVIALAGTGTDFDQSYFIDTLEREISFDSGFIQRIRAKNSSPERQVTPPADAVMSVTG
jgi:hypothetical protein